jgi:hypothetical protein
MTEIENTLYILENLSTTDSEDYLDSAEIEVYYGDDQSNEGMSTTYDMPTIADKAIKAIVELHKANAELEKERDDLRVKLSKAETESCEAKAIRDLEQQAKGVYDVRATTGFWNLSTCLLRTHLRGYEVILKNKAKALKKGKQ